MADLSLYYRPLISFTKSLPDLEFLSSDILIFDSKLKPELDSLINRFKHKLEIISGEKTKDVSELSPIISWVNSLSLVKPRFFALGGGSIGDLTGFIASIYKRGCPLISIPTTWLSAIDSAHGGKNALNADGVKNNVGTYYAPEEIHISQAILKQLPPEFEKDAWSELIKIAIIDSESLFNRFCAPNLDIWDVLPDAIEAKYKVVALDPCEKLGRRRVLNLGHTLGHALEAKLGLSHGKSIGYGLRFALNLSQKMGFLENELFVPRIPSLSELIATLKISPNLTQQLEHDKKNEGDFCNFVFVRKPGDVFTHPILISALKHEIFNLIDQS